MLNVRCDSAQQIRFLASLIHLNGRAFALVVTRGIRIPLSSAAPEADLDSGEPFHVYSRGFLFDEYLNRLREQSETC